MFKKVSLPLLMLTLYGCQSTSTPSVENDFSSKTLVPQTPQASASPDISVKVEGKLNDKGTPFSPREEEDLKPIFDNAIPTKDPKQAIPGAITVIYKNAHEIRVDKNKQIIQALNDKDVAEIQKIFSDYDLISIDDLAYPGITPQQLEEDVRK